MNQPKRQEEVVRIADTSGDQHQYLTFQIGQEMFAVGILHIREIIEYGSLTTVPMMPAFVRGVINLRGSVVPVIDLAARFGRGESEINRRSCVVILEIESTTGAEDSLQEIGIIVDSVSEVLEIPPTEIEPAPSFGARIRAEFIAGMGKVQGQFVILLDVQQALNTREMAELAAIADTTQDGAES